MKSKLKVIVGLGNPGEAYKRTRHNAGARSVEMFAKTEDVSLKPNRSFKSLFANVDFEGNPLLFILPQTFMNLSGEAVLALLKKKNVDVNRLLVVHDEIALPLGVLRFKSGGSDAGHNGIASIIEKLGTKDFPRLRLGVGSDLKYDNLADYVLAPFRKDEETTLKIMLEKSVEAIQMWAREGLAPAMNRFNKKA